MTRPLDDNTNPASDVGKVRQRVTRLERRPNPVAPAAGTINAIHLWSPSPAIVVGNNNNAKVTFDNVSPFDATVFSTVGSPRVSSVHLLKAGWYSTFCRCDWTTTFFVGNVGMHHLFTGDTLSGYDYVFPTTGSGSSYRQYFGMSYTRYYPTADDALPGAPEWWVSQNSGSSRTLSDVYWEFAYLGAGDYSYTA